MDGNNPMALALAPTANSEPSVSRRPSKASAQRLASLEEFYRRRCDFFLQPDGSIKADLRPLTIADVSELAGLVGGLLRGTLMRMENRFGFARNGDRWGLPTRLEQFVRAETMPKRK